MAKEVKEIKEQDVIALIEDFKKYCDTAEQHEFVRLAMVNVLINKTQPAEIVKDQKEARSMFRVILKTIGKDASEYEEI